MVKHEFISEIESMEMILRKNSHDFHNLMCALRGQKCESFQSTIPDQLESARSDLIEELQEIDEPENSADETIEQAFQSMIEGELVQKYVGDDDLDEDYKAELAAFKDLIPVDNKELRLTIPSTSNIKVNGSIIWKMLKDLIGKDMSKFQFPIFVNEPCTILMKVAESGFHSVYLSEIAEITESSALRLANLATKYSATF